MKLTLVPSGEFMMGSKESAQQTVDFFTKNYGMYFGITGADLFKTEHPQHRVRITKAFYLGTCHVTRSQFRQFVKDSGYKTDAENGAQTVLSGAKRGASAWNATTESFDFNEKYYWQDVGFEQTDEHAVVDVSWNDAAAFCKWLSQKEGKTCRLPTEAEWEYACRAGTTTRYYSGDDPEKLAKVGNIADASYRAKFPSRKCEIKASDGFVFTAPVGRFQPNGFGLYDMLGNAFQWCSDWCDDDYYRKSPQDDPKGPDNVPFAEENRVIRGGSWSSCPVFARCAAHGGLPPSDRYNNVGFRVVQVFENKAHM
jgi:formylglycine-generating enzyme required for sulfatase activity